MNGREQRGQTYGHSTQELHHWGTTCQSALSVDKGSQTCRNPLLDVGSVCNTYYDEWVEHFKVGKTNITNKSWSGHLSMLLTEVYIQRVDALISEDGWIMLEPVMATVSISYGFAQAAFSSA